MPLGTPSPHPGLLPLGYNSCHLDQLQGIDPQDPKFASQHGSFRLAVDCETGWLQSESEFGSTIRQNIKGAGLHEGNPINLVISKQRTMPLMCSMTSADMKLQMARLVLASC